MGLACFLLRGNVFDGIPISRKTKETSVTIQKKSLISTLNTTKKAIVASTPVQPAVSASEGRSNSRSSSRSVARATPRSVARATPRSVARATPRSVARATPRSAKG